MTSAEGRRWPLPQWSSMPRDWRVKYDIIILTNDHDASIIRVFVQSDKSERLLWLPNAIMTERLARFPKGLVEGGNRDERKTDCCKPGERFPLDRSKDAGRESRSPSQRLAARPPCP